MDALFALFVLLTPVVVIAVITTLAYRRSRKRRAEEQARGTFRNPFLFTAFGWVLGAFGALLLVPIIVFSLLLEGSPDPSITIAAVSMFVIGSIWAFVYGRRRITVWGERVDYQPFFAGERTIWAMDVVVVLEESHKVTTLYIKGRDGRAATWYRSIFLPRTVAAFRHGAHHNAIEADGRRTPSLGMVPFTVDETLEMPDGTTATWHPGRTVQLDILVSTPSEDLVDAVENGLAGTFTSLPSGSPALIFPGASTMPTGHGASVEGARLEWQRRPGTNVLTARLLAGGETGLDDARRAYSWLKTQLVDELKKHRSDGSRRRGRAGGAFTVTYRESWT